MKTLAAALAVGLLAGCSTAVPTSNPEVERVGRWVLRYNGPEIEAALGYRFADNSIGDDWMMLDLAVTGASNASVEISRDKVWLRTPSGETFGLPPQEYFGQSYSSLTAKINRAVIAADPLDYWAGRGECGLDFQVSPGSRISQLSTWVNDRRVCFGRLFFELPAGVQAGHYTLGIDLEESKVRIPFEIRAE
jgi:hypothetical protein